MSRCYARIKQCGLLSHWKTLPERETFRFGSGHRLVSTLRCRVPISVRGVPLYVWCSTVDSPTLGLLLGKDFLRGVGLRLDFMDGLGDFSRFSSTALSGVSLQELQGEGLDTELPDLSGAYSKLKNLQFEGESP